MDLNVLVFPVYAGVILYNAYTVVTFLSVPRVCGGDPINFSNSCYRLSVFPVYAGVILRFSDFDKTIMRVPRVCGGDPNAYDCVYISSPCSPCMRG